MNHSYISLAECTWVLLKHMNAREHRDWHVSLVRRALLTSTVYPCVEASPDRQLRLSCSSTMQRGGLLPRRLLWVGATGGGKEDRVSCGVTGAADSACCCSPSRPPVLDCRDSFGECGRAEHFPGAWGRQGSRGVGWLLVLVKDAGWGLCSADTEIGVCS